MSGAVDLLRRSGTADHSYQAILVGIYGDRLLSSCSRYPTFLSERALYPFTCQTLCAVYNDPPGWCHGSATRHRSPCATLPVYLISNPKPPQFLPLLTIPLTLELDAVPGCRPTMFVRHALDSPWMCWSLLYLSWLSTFCQLFARYLPWPPKSGLHPLRGDLKRPTGLPHGPCTRCIVKLTS